MPIPLPSEILTLVLKQAASHLSNEYGWTAPRLVCRVWADILEDSLFSHVCLRYRKDGSGGSRVSTMLHLLAMKPRLRQQISHLRLCVAKHDEWIYSRMLRVLECCTALRTLYLDFPNLIDDELPVLYIRAIHQKFLSLLRIVACLKLDELMLEKVSFDSIIATMKDIGPKRLTLVQCSWSGDALCPAAIWSSVDPAASLDSRVRQQPSHEWHRTGKIKHIQLFIPWSRPAEIVQFLQWPETLESLYLADLTLMHRPDPTVCMPISLKEGHCTVKDTEAILETQRETLRNIHAGCLHNTSRPEHSLSFRNFPALENLTVAAMDVFRETPSIQLEQALSPALTRLHVYYCPRVPLLEYRIYSADHIISCFRRLQSCIVNNPESARLLKTIHITLPDHGDFMERDARGSALSLAEHLPETKWPADWLVVVQKEMASHGIKVTYSGPVFVW